MKKYICLAVILLCIGNAIIEAQPTQPSERRSGIQAGQSNEDNDRNITNMVTWRLLGFLNLDREKGQKLFPILFEYNSARGKIVHDRRELYRKIGNSIDNQSVSNDVLLSMVKELEKGWKDEYDIHEKMLRDARKILDDRQYAKMIMFEEVLREDVLNQIRQPRSSSRGQ